TASTVALAPPAASASSTPRAPASSPCPWKVSATAGRSRGPFTTSAGRTRLGLGRGAADEATTRAGPVVAAVDRDGAPVSHPDTVVMPAAAAAPMIVRRVSLGSTSDNYALTHLRSA